MDRWNKEWSGDWNGRGPPLVDALGAGIAAAAMEEYRVEAYMEWGLTVAAKYDTSLMRKSGSATPSRQRS